MIRNPYSNNNYHQQSSAPASASISTMVPVPSIPAGPEAYSGTETMVRNLLRSAVPSLASVQELREELRVRRGVRWSEELARDFGNMVVNCVKFCTTIHDDGSKTAFVGGADAAKSETVGAATLGLLATVMEDWEDHVLYAVLVHESNNNNGRFVSGEHSDEKTKRSAELVGCVHMLDLLTRLSARSEIRNSTSDSGCETIRENATICLATSWRCLDRLDQFTTLASGNNNGGYGREHGGSPWWLSGGQLTNSLAVTSLQSLCKLHGCSGSDSADEFSLQRLRQEGSSRDQEQLKVSLMTIIAILLRYELLELSTSSVSSTITASSSMGSCIIPERILSEIISKLIKSIQVLNHSVLSPSSSEYTLPIAMLSLSVLSLLQRSLALSENDSLFHGLNQTIQSTGLVENLVQFTFFSSVPTASNCGTSSMTAPRWTSSSSNRFREGYLQAFGLYLFSCWSFCDNAAWKVLVANLEPKLNYLIDSFWSNMLENDCNQHRNASMNDDCNLEGQLPGILWLYLYLRRHARNRLTLVLEKTLSNLGRASSSMLQQDEDATQGVTGREKASGKIVQSLFGFLRLSSGTSYSTRFMVARLLRIILSGRRTVCSNDELSRCLWTAIDESVVEGHFESVLEHACTDDANQPLLLALVDTMETMLESSKCCNHLVDKLGAHNLEALIYLVKPKNVRYDFTLGMDVEAAHTDTETPPLHNLSKMDETSICIEHEEVKEPRGLDHSVRLSVATSLAHLAYGSSVAPPDESVGLLVSRISSAVNDLLVDYHGTIERVGNSEVDTNSMTTWAPSMDQIKRFTRLQYRIATPENEDFLTITLFTSMALRKKAISKFVDTQKETEHKLQLTLQREKKAQEEKMRLMQQLRTQSILFQREMSRTKTNLTQETRQLVSIHASERANAERRSNRLLQHTEQATIELERGKTELQTAQAELQTTRSMVDELNSTIGIWQQEVQDERVKANEIVNEANANREALKSYEEKCGDMQNTINERDEMINSVEFTNQKLQDNLEDLFADMSSLSQMYQHKENQEESQKLKNTKAIEDVNQKLAKECRRNEDLTSKMVDIEEENEKLYRKLGKYKERLEQERKGRREEQERRKEEEHRRKRNGPVSYLNSLHTSSSTIDIDSSHSRSVPSSRDKVSSSKRPSSHNPIDMDSSHGKSMQSSTFSQRPPSHNKSRDRSTHENENSSSRYHSSTSQRRTKY